MIDALIFATVVIVVAFATAAIAYAWGYVIARCMELLLATDKGWARPVLGFVLLVAQLFGAFFLLGMIRVVFA